jgi:hypothetical protein
MMVNCASSDAAKDGIASPSCRAPLFVFAYGETVDLREGFNI